MFITNSGIELKDIDIFKNNSVEILRSLIF
jgi:hypothetical protein